MPMNLKEIKELIDFLIEKDVAEFELERGDVKVRLKRSVADAQIPATHYVAVPPVAAPVVVTPAAAPVSAAAPVPAAAPAPTAPAAGEEEAGLHVIRSPIVGTFYESPSPGAPAFAKVGDKVSVGQVLCIIEAMKLMNEIESDFAGELVKRYVSNGQPVEYGQPLFAVRAQ